MARNVFDAVVDDGLPSAEDVVLTRADGAKHGLAARPGAHRSQEAAVHSGHKHPHKLAQAKAGGRDSRKNQSAQLDAKAQRHLSK